MQIGWIQLLEFRNYRTLRYDPSPKLNILAGPNAQGKTNLLEGLAFLLTGRSFRTSRLGDLPRWGESAASLVGEISRTEGSRAIRRAVQRREDGNWQAAGEGCAWARVIVFGWQDLTVVNGMPAARRNFIDGAAARLYPSHVVAFRRYRDVIAARNQLLRLGLPPSVAATRLEPWDEQLATVGVELIAKRRRAAAALQQELARIYPALAGARHKVEIRYRSELGEVAEPSALLAAIERARGEEIRRRQTLVGPHRDDLAIELDGIDARVFGSRGQQRLLALALRLAEVLPVREAAGSAPVLLLDDALSELDADVRANVLREVEMAEQVFLTTPESLRVPTATCWEVKGGGIAAA